MNEMSISEMNIRNGNRHMSDGNGSGYDGGWRQGCEQSWAAGHGDID